jgi:hypothetical protein
VQGVKFLRALAIKYNLFDLYARKLSQYGNFLHHTKFLAPPWQNFNSILNRREGLITFFHEKEKQFCKNWNPYLMILHTASYGCFGI